MSTGKQSLGRILPVIGKNRGLAILIVVALVVLSIPLWLQSAPGGASVESRLSDGLLGMRRLLEEWSTEVQLVKIRDSAQLEELLLGSEESGSEESQESPVAFLAFPIQRSLLGIEIHLDRWVRDGGNLVVGYSGVLLALEEDAFLAELGVEIGSSFGRNSLSPIRWWREKREGERHALDMGKLGLGTGTSDLVSNRVSAMPAVDTECEAMAQRSDESESSSIGSRASVVRCSHGEGEIWLAPTSALSNARLANEGNLELLWHLRAHLGSRWLALEGTSEMALSLADEERSKNTRATLNLMAIQLVLLYLGSVVALGWGFGPRWAESKQPPEGHRSFLLGLGALHQNLGGLGTAAQLLHERWLDYDPLARRRTLVAPKEVSMSEEELVELAEKYSRKVTGSVNRGEQQ